MKLIAQSFIYSLFLFLFSFKALAENEVSIFDVKKNLKLREDEKTYKDYYINGGSEIGLKPGMVLTVKRRRSLYDGFQNKSLEELMIVVGKLKLIHVQKGVSVGRKLSLFSKRHTPVLDYEYIMLGDRVDLNTVYMDRGKEKKSVSRKPQVKSEKKAEKIESSSVEKVSKVSSTAKSVELPQRH